MNKNDLPASISILPPDFNGLSNRVSCIKALRVMTGLGLKEAKDACERSGIRQIFSVNPTIIAGDPAHLREFHDCARILRSEGFEVGAPIERVLTDLRKLACEAIEQGEDELGNEILQLVLAEKLRRDSIK
jgi:hypothetical protein